MDLLENIRNSPRLAKWDIRPIDFALFISFVIGCAFVVSGVLVSAYAAISGEEFSGESLPFVIASGFGLQLGCLLAWYLFRLLVQYENKDQPDTLSRSIIIGAIGFVAIYIVLIPVSLLWKLTLTVLQIEFDDQLPVLLIQNGGSNLEMSLMAILVVIAAPISEELVYRGFLYRYLNHRLSPVLAIIISSVLFAMMHQNVFSLVPLFALGSALCIVYRLSGNLVSSIVMHSLFNLLNFVLIVFVETIDT